MQRAQLGFTTDAEAIRDLLGRWAFEYDEVHLEVIEECFTEDAVFTMRRGGDVIAGPVRGRPALTEFLKGFDRTTKRRHLIINSWFEALDASSATVVSNVLIVQLDGSQLTPTTMGYYRDEVVKTDRWRIRSRTGDYDNAPPSRPATGS
jgi:SnoaL-like domain